MNGAGRAFLFIITLMRRTRLLLWFGVISCLISTGWAEALPTKVRVRAVSRDAKIIGTGVGGALITIQDSETGEILARGMQLGGTGDTDRIMVAPRTRNATVYDTEKGAYFEAVLMLDHPTQVEVIAEGPMGFPQAVQRASKSLLLVPGKDIGGEGILLEIHGFIVRLLSSPDLPAGRPAEVKARLNMT